MESKRFETVASTPEIIITPEKSALRVELQYGKQNAAPELVLAEMYFAAGTWKYTRSQIRLEVSKENVKALLENVKAMYESSTKVVKETKAEKTTDVLAALAKMSDSEKAAILAALASSAKAPETPKTTAKTKESDLDLTLASILTKATNKRRK